MMIANTTLSSVVRLSTGLTTLVQDCNRGEENSKAQTFWGVAV